MSTETEAPTATPAETPAATPAETPAAACKQLEEAANHLMQGKRHLLVKDYTSAVSSLAEACSLITEKYGDLAPECGDPYFFYGKALLELARAEAGVIEMNTPKSSTDDEEADADADADDDDKDEDEKEDTEEEAKTDGEDAEKDGEDVEKNGEEVEKNGDEADKDVEETEKKGEEVEKISKEVKTNGEEVEKNGEDASKISKEKTENGAGTSKGEDVEEICDGEGDGDDGEVNNLQLAWEVLEMAKLIYQKQADAGTNSKEAKIRLTEVLLKLGEVGIESENWPTAIEDLQSCLSMQKEILNEDDRKLAETYYHLAVAHSNNNQYQESIDSFEKACGQLQLRIDSLEAKRPKADVIDKTVIDSEINELKDLLVEMKEKLNDIITEKDEPAPKDDPEDIVKNGSSKPVSSIAHLVRKKPKTDTTDSTSESKTDAGSSSESKAAVETTDKTEAQPKGEERKRKPEQEADVTVSSAEKKAKVETES